MLEELLTRKKGPIVEKWFRRVLDTYPPDTAGFLRREKDPFANPVGSAILEGVEGLYERLVRGGEQGDLSLFLDRMIRIRAVQDFSPSGALRFVLALKSVVREEVGREASEKGLGRELEAFEGRIDELLLAAFDVYMKCREQIYELRVHEVKAEREAALRILERAQGRQKKPLGDEQSNG